ncbi:MAG TPA: hypothetical protein VFO10_12755 [Oligoflexus sp.]|uniref:hypothetical protein n=1 Tax=Oligoflexus sp. TaxID=1971216 RepID=UPI002D7EC54E|nr:hypothetical protein [Oligoflexus sp.]HET9238121.1 hypothetical protein [Oligoflexus sp.]
MKPVLLSLLIATAFSCGSGSPSSDDNPGPVPSADQSPMSGFLPSDQNLFAAKIVWNNPPVSQSFDNSAEVHLLTPDGQPLASSRLLRFHLYMATMGHPSIKEKDMVIEQKEPGHWTVSRIFFSMGGSAGSWVVDLDVEANGVADHVRVSIDHEVE